MSVTDLISLGLTLNYSIFIYETLSDPDQMCEMTCTAFEDIIVELGGVAGSRRRQTQASTVPDSMWVSAWAYWRQCA